MSRRKFHVAVAVLILSVVSTLVLAIVNNMRNAVYVAEYPGIYAFYEGFGPITSIEASSSPIYEMHGCYLRWGNHVPIAIQDITESDVVALAQMPPKINQFKNVFGGVTTSYTLRGSLFTFDDGKLSNFKLSAELNGVQISRSISGPTFMLPVSRAELYDKFGKPNRDGRVRSTWWK